MALSAQQLALLVSFHSMEAVHVEYFLQGHATKLLRLPYLKGP